MREREGAGRLAAVVRAGDRRRAGDRCRRLFAVLKLAPRQHWQWRCGAEGADASGGGWKGSGRGGIGPVMGGSGGIGGACMCEIGALVVTLFSAELARHVVGSG